MQPALVIAFFYVGDFSLRFSEHYNKQGREFRRLLFVAVTTRTRGGRRCVA